MVSLNVLIDTHCHLNFKAFDGQVDRIVERAAGAGVERIVVPGTDYETSKKALDIAYEFRNVYAAVGVHPHHIYSYLTKSNDSSPEEDFAKVVGLIDDPKVVAIGEVGIDYHMYSKTKYKNYEIEKDFVLLQKEYLKKQIGLAINCKKSLILHNREAKRDFLAILDESWDEYLRGRTVFHCCEPDMELLEYARERGFFIGVDGDVFYSKEKQEFVKKIPIDMLVLETDSPYLSPFRKFPNVPENIADIAKFIAKLLNVHIEELSKATSKNSMKLFGML